MTASVQTGPGSRQLRTNAPSAHFRLEFTEHPMHFADFALNDLLSQTAAKTPTPGGGAVASVVGALAAALAQMVVSYSLGKKNLAEHQSRLESAAAELERARGVFLTLADEDAAAYGLVNELSRLPEGDPRRSELPAAQDAAANIPLATAAACVDVLRLLELLALRTNRHLRSDLAIASILAESCARASACNVRINLSSLDEVRRTAIEANLARLLVTAADLSATVERHAAP